MHHPRPVNSYGIGPGFFQPHGQMGQLFRDIDVGVKMASGTYDAGKTYSCVAYLHWLAKKYPGSRLTFVHRSLNRIYRNILPTYYKYLGFTPTPRDAVKPSYITRFGGEMPEFFEYDNGTRIYLNGLDKPANLLSDFFGAAFVNQAELVPFEAWDELKARVSEREGVLPITYLVGDCNPSVRHHWIRQQAKEGKLRLYPVTFLDNPEIVHIGSDLHPQCKAEFLNDPSPRLIDKYQGLFTEIGWRRVEKLRNLEGVRFKRGFLGEWGADEGLVFPRFDPEIHIVDRTLMPNWPRFLSVDWGFRNPCSVIWWARTPDDRLLGYKEIYKTGLTKPELITLIQDCMEPEDKIRFIAVDSEDQDGIQQLRDAGFRVMEPKKDRVAQIDAVRERLKVDRTGEPALMFLRERLVHPPDPELQAIYEPTEVTEEFLSLAYAEKMTGQSKKDDANVVGADHGIDSTAYLLMTLVRGQSIGSGRVIHASVKMR